MHSVIFQDFGVSFPAGQINPSLFPHHSLKLDNVKAGLLDQIEAIVYRLW